MAAEPEVLVVAPEDKAARAAGVGESGARADVQRPEAAGPEERQAPRARPDAEEEVAVTEAPMEAPEGLWADTVAGKRDTAQAEAPGPGRAGVWVAAVAAVGKVALALEGPAGALAVRGPVAVAAPVPTRQTPAQRAAPAAHAEPSAFARPAEAPVVPERCCRARLFTKHATNPSVGEDRVVSPVVAPNR